MPQQSETQAPWKQGTDLRNEDGIYSWPHPLQLEKDQVPNLYVSVTTVLDITAVGMKFAESWFTAQYIEEITNLAKQKMTVPVWNGEATVYVKPVDLMSNSLPESEFGRNFGLKWIQNAGAREMTRRANRGSVLHHAQDNWAFGMRVDPSEVVDYTAAIISELGFTINAEDAAPYVQTHLDWLNDNVVEVLMAEAVVMNDTHWIAGTADLGCRLRDFEPGKTWLLDAKTSKQAQREHEIQVATYANSEYVGIRGTNIREEMPRFDCFGNVYVQPDKCKLVPWPQDRIDQGFQTFLHLLQVWHAYNESFSAKMLKAPKPQLAASKQPTTKKSKKEDNTND